MSELIGALSHALDMTEGQPRGHCVRSCWIGMHIGRELGMPDAQQWELYYSLLLKDLGCSSNAARICQLYATDDLAFKHDFKEVDGSLPQVLRFVMRHTGLSGSLAERLRALMTIVRDGSDIAQELIQTRCERGADIAKKLRFTDGVAAGIRGLDEHWNGKGKPRGLAGEAIPLYARIALLAQVADVFQSTAGPVETLAEIQRRSGSWFDPELVRVFEQVSRRPNFWSMLRDPELEQAVMALEPAQHEVQLDEDYLDEIAAAFGQVVDSKSPYTAGHSERVAFYTDLICAQMALDDKARRWLRRGALLHDIGKLGVSNSILDKSGKLDDQEWIQVRQHAAYTEDILIRIGAFSRLAKIAGAHHERLDGKGYPRGLSAADISMETRIITTADIFDAITADRPYRGPIPIPEALAIMEKEVGTAIDADCFQALKCALEQLALETPCTEPA
jgi:HD-GYP domain-containing protein (c-di-GMP phosphodiesterase class II)